MKVIAAARVWPPLSAAVAVMWWVPTVVSRAETVPPVPSAPWRSDAQAIAGVRSPSSGSLAVPVNVTVVPSSTPDPSAGAVILTFGAPLPTVTVIDALPAVPRLLVTLAVMR